jgi:hypothetical protein
MNELKPLEELVLVTLSYFEKMTFSQVILDFDNNKLKQFPDFDKIELALVLKNLEKKKLIKKVKIDKEYGWVRVYPNQSFFKKMLRFFNFHL